MDNENSSGINNTLTAGVSPDGLKDAASIKIFICFIIDAFSGALTQNDIIDTAFERSLANYFEMCSVFDELLSDGLVVQDENTGILSLSPGGTDVAHGLFHQIPLTVREKAVEEITRRIERKQHERETSVEISPVDDGWQITCSLLGSASPLMSVSLYVPDKKYAEDARERFINDPEYLYRAVLAHLTGESRIAPDSEN